MKPARSTNLLYMDPMYPQWGWSWSERWTAAQSGESRTVKELNDYSSGKSARLAGRESSKCYARHLHNFDEPSSLNNQRPSYPSSIQSPSATPSNSSSPKICKKSKPHSPRGSVTKANFDSKSMFSLKLGQNRRHSIVGSSVRDDKSIASSPAVPSYMASTESAKAKLRQCSSLEMENGTSEKGSTGCAKKQLSSPARPMRHSSSSKCSSVADLNLSDVAVN